MANCNLLLTNGDDVLLTSASFLTLTSTCASTGVVDPIRRRFRQDTDARDLLANRPTGSRGRETTWWD